MAFDIPHEILPTRSIGHRSGIEHCVRGEIDNRVRGRVTGRIWFAGRTEPVELNLTGNGWRDLAGRQLEWFRFVGKLCPIMTERRASK